MMQHSGDGCFGGVVGSGWSPPRNTAAVRVCSRVNGRPAGRGGDHPDQSPCEGGSPTGYDPVTLGTF